MRYPIILIISFLFYSCNENKFYKPQGFEINELEYLKKHKVNSLQNCELDFTLVSNPVNWDKTNFMLIYLNGQVVFSDQFTSCGKIKFNRLKESEIVHLKLEIIKSNKLYILEPKDIFSWKQEYKKLYICLFPFNPSTENIYFFSQ